MTQSRDGGCPLPRTLDGAGDLPYSSSSNAQLQARTMKTANKGGLRRLVLGCCKSRLVNRARKPRQVREKAPTTSNCHFWQGIIGIDIFLRCQGHRVIPMHASTCVFATSGFVHAYRMLFLSAMEPCSGSGTSRGTPALRACPVPTDTPVLHHSPEFRRDGPCS